MPTDHLDDDALSELVDAGAPSEHVESCAACAARLRALQDAAALIGTPVPPLAASVVDDLVTRSTVAPVIPIGRGRRPGPQWVAGIAAAVVLLLGVPIAVRTLGDGGKGASSELSAVDADESTDSARLSARSQFSTSDAGADRAAGGSPTAAATGATKDAEAIATPPRVADLGQVDDAEELVVRLRARTSTESEPRAAESSVAVCEDAARRAGAGRLGSFVYVALAEWRGEPAEALVFLLAEPAGGMTRQAYVMSRSGCAVLADPRF